ncbi:hypothetical protein HY995_00085 [Candidatus Micrarchaeota archaeon]|nr:hypothetical protein [Candidatus Micrarchaeota archaeon]MBI5176465.1 hypothetical protein [Candidatus Micrarchaeota archaeon]
MDKAESKPKAPAKAAGAKASSNSMWIAAAAVLILLLLGAMRFGLVGLNPGQSGSGPDGNQIISSATPAVFATSKPKVVNPPTPIPAARATSTQGPTAQAVASSIPSATPEPATASTSPAPSPEIPPSPPGTAAPSPANSPAPQSATPTPFAGGVKRVYTGESFPFNGNAISLVKIAPLNGGSTQYAFIEIGDSSGTRLDYFTLSKASTPYDRNGMQISIKEIYFAGDNATSVDMELKAT